MRFISEGVLSYFVICNPGNTSENLQVMHFKNMKILSCDLGVQASAP